MVKKQQYLSLIDFDHLYSGFSGVISWNAGTLACPPQYLTLLVTHCYFQEEYFIRHYFIGGDTLHKKALFQG